MAMSDEGALMALKEKRLAAARALLNKFGLRDWKVAFADLSRVKTKSLVGESFGALGICVFQDRRILVDPCLMKHRNRFLGVVRHEISHALFGRMGHGREWLRIAKQVGCSARSLEPYRIVL